MYYCGLKQAVCPKKDTSISYNKCCYSCKEECPQRCKLFDDTDFKKCYLCMTKERVLQVEETIINISIEETKEQIEIMQEEVKKLEDRIKTLKEL